MAVCNYCHKEPAVGTSKGCPACNLKNRTYNALATAKFKKIIFNHFGDKCACCGETEPAFLTVDHINNDGHIARKKDGTGGSNFYRKLANAILEGKCPNDLQLLCRNCNWGKHVNGGICPHVGRYV